MEVNYKKWIILCVGVWLGLYSIFWSTIAYGYFGFLVSIVIIGIIVAIIYKFQKNKISSRLNKGS